MSDGDRFRAAFDALLEGMPEPPSWETVTGAVPPRRRVSGVWLAAGTGAVVAVVLGGWALLAREAPPGTLESPAGGGSPVGAVLAAKVQLPAGVVDVAVGEGSVWVPGFGSVARLDPRSDRVVAAVDTPGTGDYSRVAVGAGSVWVTADGGRVYRIDPATNRVAATIDVGGAVQGVTVGAGSVWVTRLGEDPGELIRIDPSSDTVAGDPIPVGPGPTAVTFGLGVLWVTDTSPPAVVQVDPKTEKATSTGLTGAVAVGADSVWVVGDDRVVRADPATSQPTHTFAIPRAVAAASAAGVVWVLAASESGSPESSQLIGGTAALWEIDPATNRTPVDPVHLDDLQPVALIATGSGVWIADYHTGTISRFQLTPTPPTTSPDG